MADQVDLSDRSAEKLGKEIANNLKGFNSNRDSSPTGFGRSDSGISTSANEFKNALVSGYEGIKDATGKTVDSWRRASDIGIGFNNDALGLRASVGTTRLSVDEWEASIRRGQYGFTAINGSMTESVKVFNKMSEVFSDTDAADQLRLLGYTEKEYNELLALNMSRRTAFNIRDEASRAEAIESTAQLAKEMDAVAKLTGKSRQEMMREQEERNRDVRLQAAIDSEIARGGRTARDSFNKMAVEMSAVGVDKLGRALYSGRGLTQSEMAQMGSLGGTGVQLKQAIEAVKAADKTENKEQQAAARQQFKEAIDAVNRQQNSQQFREILQYNMGPIGDAAVTIKEASTNYNLAMESIRKDLEAKGKPADEAAVRAERERRLDNERKGLDAITGQKVAGSNLTEAAVKFSARMKDTEAAMFNQVQALGNAAGKLELVATSIDKLANRKTTETGVSESSRERGGFLPKSLTTIGEAAEKGTLSTELPGILYKSTKEAVKDGMSTVKDLGIDIVSVGKIAAKDFFNGILGVGSTIKSEIKSATSSTPSTSEVPERASGSLGMTGKWIEDWGKESLVKLHGKEGVITEQQFNSLFESATKATAASPIDRQFNSAINGLQNTMSAEIEKNRANVPTVDNFQSMLTQLTAPIAQALQEKQPVVTATQPDNTAITDVKDQLVHLNTLMNQLLAYTSDVASNTGNQVRATKKLSGNALA